MNTRFANVSIIAVSIVMAGSGLLLGYRGDLLSSIAAGLLMVGGFLLFLMKHRLDDTRLEVNALARVAKRPVQLVKAPSAVANESRQQAA